MYRNLSASIFIFLIAVSSSAQQSGDWFNLDPEVNDQYGISVYEAFKKYPGLELQPVTVAVIDGGLDVFHPDLEGRLWINEGEVADNGVDDDGNGYVDDVHGWNFLGNASGENIRFDNLEITRLYRTYKQKYETKDRSTLSRKEKKEYDKYTMYKSQYDMEVDEVEEDFAQFAQLTALYKGALAYMQEQLKTEDISMNQLIDYQSTDAEDMQVRDFLLMAERQSLPEYLRESAPHFQESLEYHYNLDFNPEDSLANPKQEGKGYGNNKVWAEDAGHGTHVAGIIGAVRNNAIGVDGIAPNARIMALRAVPNGDERDVDVANAIRYAVDNGAKVINMSFGKSYSPNKELVINALKYAESKDVLLVHAAGNDGANNDHELNFPDGTAGKRKSISSLITVGATSPSLDSTFLADFSNYGRRSVDILAPGVNILSLAPNGGSKVSSGTSMAAPVISGFATVIRGAAPSLSAKDVKKLIIASISNQKNLEVGGMGDEVQLKKLVRNPGVPSLKTALDILN